MEKILTAEQFVLTIKEAPVKENAKAIADTVLQAFDENNTMLPYMERLEKILPGIAGLVCKEMSYEEIYGIVERLVEQQVWKDKSHIEEKTDYFYGIAKQRLTEAIAELMRLFGMEYPELPHFICCLGIYNPFPRSVLGKEYGLHFDVSDEVFLRASLHEINHMILFDKWNSMHDCHDRREPEFPDPLWFLEELAIAPTLNDSCIQKILPIRHRAYASLEETVAWGIPLTDRVQQIYDKSDTIECFLEDAYLLLTKYIQGD